MKISNSIEIQAPPDRVFYWLEDPGRTKKWMTSVTKSEIINETPNKVGTTFREEIGESGQELEVYGVVTEFVPDKRFAVRLESTINKVNVSFDLEEIAGGTRLTQQADLRFKGLVKVMTLFMRGGIKRKIKAQSLKEFSKLKELCEKNS